MTTSHNLSILLVLMHFISFVHCVPFIPVLLTSLLSGSNFLNVQIDTLGLTKFITDAVHRKKNRSGFVKDLMYAAFYESKEKYNVIVFNLNEEHEQKLTNIKFYGSVEYTDGAKFGVWVFDSGVFKNKGARGWHNWAMIGSFSKDDTGNVITFTKRVTKKSAALIRNDFLIDVDVDN